MIGTDHSIADVDVRARFSFTKKSTAETLQEIVKKPGILGAVILSTCNRMELYVNVAEGVEPDLVGLLCGLKGVDTEKYRPFLVQRREKQAIEHLFYLACGLKSRILAEDQILSQVLEALALSREWFCTDHVLEVLFRRAVTAAKKVKTGVVFSHANQTAMDQAIALLRAEDLELSGMECMVIGNGEMGKLCATALKQAGAHVTVTVRQYRSGVVSIPVGCDRINYGDRMSLLPSCKVVVSATSSPNYTLRPELFEDVDLKEELILIDLAVPRDIDPKLAEHPMIRLYNIDDFKLPEDERNRSSFVQASEILSEEMQEFYRWYDGVDQIPRILKLEEAAANDLALRLAKPIRQHGLLAETEEQLKEEIDRASRKVANKILFSLKNGMEEEQFSVCLELLEKAFAGEMKG